MRSRRWRCSPASTQRVPEPQHLRPIDNVSLPRSRSQEARRLAVDRRDRRTGPAHPSVRRQNRTLRDEGRQEARRCEASRRWHQRRHAAAGSDAKEAYESRGESEPTRSDQAYESRREGRSRADRGHVEANESSAAQEGRADADGTGAAVVDLEPVMTKAKPWSALAARLALDGGPGGPEDEFFMPLEIEDMVGVAAWSAHAASLGAVFRPSSASGGQGVAWPCPPARQLARGLGSAKKKRALLEAQDGVDAAKQRRLLDRILRDLESYRDHGRSTTSSWRADEQLGPVKEKRKS